MFQLWSKYTPVSSLMSGKMDASKGEKCRDGTKYPGTGRSVPQPTIATIQNLALRHEKSYTWGRFLLFPSIIFWWKVSICCVWRS